MPKILNWVLWYLVHLECKLYDNEIGCLSIVHRKELVYLVTIGGANLYLVSIFLLFNPNNSKVVPLWLANNKHHKRIYESLVSRCFICILRIMIPIYTRCNKQLPRDDLLSLLFGVLYMKYNIPTYCNSYFCIIVY